MLLGALLLTAQFALSGVRPDWSRSTTLRLAYYALVLYLAQVPLVASTLYWLNASAVYTVGCVLALLLGLAAREAQATTTRTQWGLATAVVAFLLVGSNELFMLVTVAGSAVWVALAPRQRRRWPGVLLGAALASAVVTLAAPGNSNRVAVVGSSTPCLPHLLSVGSKGAYLTVYHLLSWASSGILLLGTVVFGSMYRPVARPCSGTKELWAGLEGIVIMAVLTVPTL